MTSEIFYELKNPDDEQAIKFEEFIKKAKQIKLKGVNAAPDSSYKVGSLKYFKARCPSLGEFNNRDHFANLKKRFDKSIGESNSNFNKDLFSEKLNKKLERWAEENPQYGDAGFFGAAGIDAPAKAFAAFLSLLHEEGYLSDSDLNDGEIIAIQRKPQNSNGGNMSGENGVASLSSLAGGINEEDYLEKIFSKLSLNKNVIVEGVAGSGKSHMLQELRESGVYGENGSQIEVVVFHPSTSYEEFVSGIRPNFMKEGGEGEFVSQEGVFIDVCNRAADNPDKKFLLFIDEINRANTSRVFGDLMLVIEDSKRVDFSKFQIEFSEREGENQPGGGKEPEAKLKEPEIIDLKTGDPKDSQNTENDERLSKGFRYGALFSSKATIPSTKDGKNAEYVRLQTPIVKRGIEFNKLVVPANLHVLGTMNTTDRSVGTIDLALRRRFHWITQEPMNDRDELLTALKLSGDKEKSVGLVVDWFMHANTVLKTEVGPDARLGHAYFFGENGDVEVIAAALLNQLKEIAFTFNIDEKVLWGRKGQEENADYWQNNKDKKSIGAIKVINNYWAIRYEGKGLGRRPEIVKDVSIAKAESNGIDDQGEEAADDTNN